MEVPMRLLILVLALFPALALAQSGDATRGNTPPGMSQDGSRPMDGAVKGGSIVPGEKAGEPDKENSSTELLKRCDALSGTVRAEWLKKGRSPGGRPSSTASRPRPKATPVQ